MKNFSIFDVLPRPLQNISVLDVGARFTGDERYASLLRADVIDLTGIEPDESHFLDLKERYPNHNFLPLFIADGSKRTFYKCHYGGCSSLFRPNPKIINEFTSMATSSGSNFEIVSQENVQTHKVDEVDEIPKFDHLKIDVQGAELDVLRGSVEKLKCCVAAEIEVEFLPLYENQPLFGEVEAFMREQGFFFHRFMDFSGRAFRPYSVPGNIVRPLSQFLWADAVFVRKFTIFDQLETESLLKLAILLHELYTSIDLCARVIAEYDAKQGSLLHERYLDEISRKGIETSFVNVKDWSD